MREGGGARAVKNPTLKISGPPGLAKYEYEMKIGLIFSGIN
jgi:hypothetical protein